MTRKCIYGVCKNDSRYDNQPHMKGVRFIQVPNRKKYSAQRERWLNACGRVDFNDALKPIGNSCSPAYICSIHFVGGLGPTRTHPDPIPCNFIVKTVGNRRMAIGLASHPAQGVAARELVQSKTSSMSAEAMTGCSETEDFILPDVKSECQMQIKSEPPEDSILSPEAEYILGPSFSDELASLQIKLEPSNLDPSSEPFERSLEPDELELVSEDHDTTRSKDLLNMPSERLRFNGKNDLPNSATSVIREVNAVHLNQINENHEYLVEVDNELTQEKEISLFQNTKKLLESSTEIQPKKFTQVYLHCNKRFECLEDLRKHQLTHEKVQIINTCLRCSKTFTEISLLMSHMNMHILEESNENSNPVSSNNCLWDKFSSRASEDQCQTGNVEKIPEKVCRSINTSSQGELHTSKTFRCNVCEEVFSGKFELEQHLQKPHTENKTLPYKGSQQKSQQHILHKLEPKPYKCCHCEKAFKHKHNLKSHIFLHSGAKPHQCSFCGKAFSAKKNLKTHHLLHTGETPHECNQCGKTFRQKRDLDLHILSHSGLKPHNCSECGKGFKSITHLNQHIFLHTEEKRYKCSHCEKAYAYKSHLKSHLLTHFGKKPYHCSFCDKDFRLVCNLKQHLLTHTGEKPYSCMHCGKSFRLNNHLKTHIITHSDEKPYKCHLCEKSFSQTTRLKMHLLTHSSDPVYKCSQCENVFSQKSDLKAHSLSHSIDKSHTCSQCGKVFSTKNYLKRHMISHIPLEKYITIVNT